MNRTQNQGAKWQSTLGLTGLLAWMFMFGVVEYAHDALMAKRGGHDFWATVYEISAGYTLGFVTALAVWMLAKLARGTTPRDFVRRAMDAGIVRDRTSRCGGQCLRRACDA